MNSIVHQLPVNQPAKIPGRSETPITPIYRQLPEAGFLRLNQIVKVPGGSEPPIIPIISRTSFLNGVKSGKYPLEFYLVKGRESGLSRTSES